MMMVVVVVVGMGEEEMYQLSRLILSPSWVKPYPYAT